MGADHAGYIKRITSVVEALSGEKNKLICKVSQLVKLIKDGKPFKMSKRKGDYITVEDLISEVGKDATRFIMLSRSNDAELDFDFTKKLEPHRIPVYLYELSSQFHSYWNMGKDDVEKRFINDDKTINLEKLIFLKSIAKTIKTGMDIIGVDTPEKM